MESELNAAYSPPLQILNCPRIPIHGRRRPETKTCKNNNNKKLL